MAENPICTLTINQFSVEQFQQHESTTVNSTATKDDSLHANLTTRKNDNNEIMTIMKINENKLVEVYKRFTITQHFDIFFCGRFQIKSPIYLR